MRRFLPLVWLAISLGCGPPQAPPSRPMVSTPSSAVAPDRPPLSTEGLDERSLAWPDDFRRGPSPTLTGDQRREDLRVLLHALRDGYGGARHQTGYAKLAETTRLRLEQARRGALVEEKVVRHAPVDVAKTAFGGPTIVLVDAGCASSCESTFAALRKLPNTTVVGERTAGYVHFGDVGLLLLPNSRVLVEIPTTYSAYPGGVTYDKVGMPVDRGLATGEDGLEVALQLIKK